MFHESIKLRAAKLSLKGGDLAAMANISAPALSLFFKGRKHLDADKRNKLIQVLDDVENLMKHFPVPIGVHDAKLLMLAIERLRDGKFSKFQGLTTATDWSVQDSEIESLQRHYPKLWKKQ